MRAFTVATLVAGAGLVSAQSISSGCKSTLEQIVASPDAACLNAGALVSLALGSSSNASIVTPIDSWLSGLCSTAPCSNDTLSALVTNVTSGCSSDLSSFGITLSNSTLSTTIADVQQAYPTVRNIVCLKDTSSNTNCITETLNNIQSSTGTLTLSNVASSITKLFSSSSIPTNVTCSNCVKQAYNLVDQAYPQLAGTITQAAQQQCGQSFTDGSTPSGIQETASNSSSSSSKSGAVSMMPPMNTLAGGAITALLAVSSVFTLFA